MHSSQHKPATVAVTKMETRGRALDNILSRIYALREARRRGGKAAAAASLVAFFYLAVVFRQGRRPEVVCRRNGHNVRILRVLARVIDHPYYPSWLTPNAHVNCMLGFAKRGPKVNKTREFVRAWGELFAVRKVDERGTRYVPLPLRIAVVSYYTHGYVFLLWYSYVSLRSCGVLCHSALCSGATCLL